MKVTLIVIIAFLMTGLLMAIAYAGWGWTFRNSGEALMNIVLDRDIEVCGVSISQRLELAGYDLQQILSEPISCDHKNDMCFVNCLASGGAPDIGGGCWHICGVVEDGN